MNYTMRCWATAQASSRAQALSISGALFVASYSGFWSSAWSWSGVLSWSWSIFLRSGRPWSWEAFSSLSGARASSILARSTKNKIGEIIMTDRIKSLKITLEENTREDDCQILVDAISLFPNVVEVEKEVFNVSNEIKEKNLYDKVKSDLCKKIVNFVNSIKTEEL